MDQINQEGSFEYTYSAPQNAEIQRIREKYLPKELVKWSSCAVWTRVRPVRVMPGRWQWGSLACWCWADKPKTI